jgi:hypothetical protein
VIDRAPFHLFIAMTLLIGTAGGAAAALPEVEDRPPTNARMAKVETTKAFCMEQVAITEFDGPGGFRAVAATGADRFVTLDHAGFSVWRVTPVGTMSRVGRTPITEEGRDRYTKVIVLENDIALVHFWGTVAIVDFSNETQPEVLWETHGEFVDIAGTTEWIACYIGEYYSNPRKVQIYDIRDLRDPTLTFEEEAEFFTDFPLFPALLGMARQGNHLVVFVLDRIFTGAVNATTLDVTDPASPTLIAEHPTEMHWSVFHTELIQSRQLGDRGLVMSPGMSDTDSNPKPLLELQVDAAGTPAFEPLTGRDEFDPEQSPPQSWRLIGAGHPGRFDTLLALSPGAPSIGDPTILLGSWSGPGAFLTEAEFRVTETDAVDAFDPWLAALDSDQFSLYPLDPSVGNPSPASTVLSQETWVIDCTDEICVNAQRFGGLLTLDLRDPSRPAVRDRLSTGTDVRAVTTDGVVAVAVADEQLMVVDVSNPNDMQLACRFESEIIPDRVAIEGDRIYVSGHSPEGIFEHPAVEVFSLPFGSCPVSLGLFVNDGNSTYAPRSRIVVLDGIAYINAYDELVAIDFNNPGEPVVLSRTEMPVAQRWHNSVAAMTLLGHRVLVSIDQRWVLVYNLEQPEEPRLEKTIEHPDSERRFPTAPHEMVTIGDRVIATWDESVVVLGTHHGEVGIKRWFETNESGRFAIADDDHVYFFTLPDVVTARSTCTLPIAAMDWRGNGREVFFTNSSSGDWESCLWDFGDGTFSTQANPRHVYAVAQPYEVTLTIEFQGQSDSATTTIDVGDTPAPRGPADGRAGGP